MRIFAINLLAYLLAVVGRQLAGAAGAHADAAPHGATPTAAGTCRRTGPRDLSHVNQRLARRRLRAARTARQRTPARPHA